MTKNGSTGKKICHISFSPFPSDPRIRRYVNSLTENNYYVYVICIGGPGEPKFEKLINLEIFRLHVNKKRSSYFRRVFEYIAFFTLAGFKSTILFFKQKIGLFHTHNLPDFVVFTALIPRLFGAKVILDMHELTPEAMMMMENLDEKNWLIRLAGLIERISVKAANMHITIHDIAAGILSSRNKKVFIPIINGIESSEIKEIKKADTPNFNIVYHGTINPNLNLSIILDAFEYLKRTLPENEFKTIKFLLYGSGPSLPGLTERAGSLGLNDNFKYMGELKHDEMLKELGKASVSVYPPLNNVYTEICYPVKITELINLGIPIIASRFKTLLHYYPEECFFYFNAGDVKGIAEQILTVKHNPELVNQKVKNAIEEYNKVSWDKIMKKRYLDIINKAFK